MNIKMHMIICFASAASIPGWLKWAFWSSPLTYAEIGLAVNEFLAPRWEKVRQTTNSLVLILA